MYASKTLAKYVSVLRFFLLQKKKNHNTENRITKISEKYEKYKKYKITENETEKLGRSEKVIVLPTY